jgi:hypothetical protein
LRLQAPVAADAAADDDQTTPTSQTTSVPNAESFDKEAEKQRVLSLVARVTEMLRTGTVGPITKQDVSIAKRNFSPVHDKTPTLEGKSADAGSSATAQSSESQHHQGDAQRRVRGTSEESSVRPSHVIDVSSDVSQRVRGCSLDRNSRQEIETRNCASRDTSRRVLSSECGVGDQPSVGSNCEMNHHHHHVTGDVDLRCGWIVSAQDEDLRSTRLPFADGTYKVINYCFTNAFRGLPSSSLMVGMSCFMPAHLLMLNMRSTMSDELVQRLTC